MNKVIYERTDHTECFNLQSSVLSVREYNILFIFPPSRFKVEEFCLIRDFTESEKFSEHVLVANTSFKTLSKTCDQVLVGFNFFTFP